MIAPVHEVSIVLACELYQLSMLLFEPRHPGRRSTIRSKLSATLTYDNTQWFIAINVVKA